MQDTSKDSDLNKKTRPPLIDLNRKTSRLVTWVHEDENVTYAKMMYFCIFLAIGFTWNINAVIIDHVDTGTEAKESSYALCITILTITGIALVVPQLTKLKYGEPRRHRPIPAHMSIVIWFLGILTVISELWMALRHI